MEVEKIKINIIEDIRKSHNLSKVMFCKECGISVNSYNSLLGHKYNISCEILFKICRTYKIRCEDLLI